MKKILVFGTFDLFHPGHAWFLTQAKQYGSYLVVIVARDINVKKIKGKLPVQSEQIRLQQVQQFPVVNLAKLGETDFSKRFKVITVIKPQLICLGYDQAIDLTELKKWNVPYIRLAAHQPEKYKSSLLTKLG
ncbi:MAG: adenylyltransferase/cytidyltransferase family protein [Patescibacteria group bacterium]|jgi:cytidyltransferase-like protein